MTIIEFYDGGTDCEGRTLQEILSKSDDWFEVCHDYIQWLFPLPELSNFNENAPILTEKCIRAFHHSTKLQDNMLLAFERFLKFLGLEISCKVGKVTFGKNWEDRKVVFSQFNHNYLRISRCLGCLTFCGLGEFSNSFLECLQEIKEKHGVVSENAMSYWIKACDNSSIKLSQKDG